MRKEVDVNLIFRWCKIKIIFYNNKKSIRNEQKKLIKQ